MFICVKGNFFYGEIDSGFGSLSARQIMARRGMVLCVSVQC